MEYYNIAEYNKFQCAEAKFLTHIEQVFESEIIIYQYIVKNYRIDAYFPHYNIVIEIDEQDHIHYNLENEQKRFKIIDEELNKPHFIRFNPSDTNIFDVLRKIYNIIKNN